jgi:DNA repair/transcription protein MET18/MMS19
MAGNLLCDFILARTEDGDGIGPCARALTALEERGKWDSERVQKVMQTCVPVVAPSCPSTD